MHENFSRERHQGGNCHFKVENRLGNGLVLVGGIA